MHEVLKARAACAAHDWKQAKTRPSATLRLGRCLVGYKRCSAIPIATGL
jgi:hypothetical protein